MGWGRRFGLSVAVSFSVIVAAGWFTDLRDPVHSALVTLLAVALFPFLVIAGVLALGLIGGCIPFELFERAGPGIGRYYRFLGRQRHPATVGSAFGAVLGVLALWGLLMVYVIPRETETAVMLTRARIALSQHLAEHDQFPEPLEHGVARAVLDPGAPLGQLAVDAFGRPLRYERRRKWTLEGYRLRSSGYDGELGTRDDFCVEGASPAARRASRALSALVSVAQLADSDRLAELLTALPVGELSYELGLDALRSLRCR